MIQIQFLNIIIDFITVYYLPNGYLHTLKYISNRAVLDNNILYVWFKDNSIHQDNDVPAVILLW